MVFAEYLDVSPARKYVDIAPSLHRSAAANSTQFSMRTRDSRLKTLANCHRWSFEPARKEHLGLPFPSSHPTSLAKTIRAIFDRVLQDHAILELYGKSE